MPAHLDLLEAWVDGMDGSGVICAWIPDPYPRGKEGDRREDARAGSPVTSEELQPLGSAGTHFADFLPE